MHTRITIFILLTISSLWGKGQIYKGGNGNGISNNLALAAQLGVTDGLYNGSSSNGFSNTTASATVLGVIDSLFNGGSGNGFSNAMDSSALLAIIDNLYNGGNGNGFSNQMYSAAILGTIDSLYNGGHGTGFTTLVNTSTAVWVMDSLYNGGTGRGERIITGTLNLGACGPTTIWNGSVSNVWSDAANWDCNAVPGVNSVVLIPSGLARYPTVFSAAEIKQLSVQDGASVRVKSNVQFKINGR